MILGYEKKLEILEEFGKEINGKFPIIVNETRLISSEIIEKVFQILIEEQTKVIKAGDMVRAKTVKELHDCYDLFLMCRADAIWTINNKQWKSMNDKNYKFQVTDIESRRIECKCWKCNKSSFCDFSYYMNYFFKTLTPSRTKRINKNFFTYNGFKILIRTYYDGGTKDSLEFREQLIKFMGDIYFKNKLDNQGKIKTDKIDIKNYFKDFNMTTIERNCNRNITLYASMAFNNQKKETKPAKEIKTETIKEEKEMTTSIESEKKTISNLYELLRTCLIKLERHQKILKDAQSLINKQSNLIESMQNQINSFQYC